MTTRHLWYAALVLWVVTLVHMYAEAPHEKTLACLIGAILASFSGIARMAIEADRVRWP